MVFFFSLGVVSGSGAAKYIFGLDDHYFFIIVFIVLLLLSLMMTLMIFPQWVCLLNYFKNYFITETIRCYSGMTASFNQVLESKVPTAD